LINAHRINTEGDACRPVTHTLWYAPDLDCEPVRRLTESRDNDGSIRDRFEDIPLSIKLGEPDAALFSIPTDYVEMSPSAYRQKIWEAVHREPMPPKSAEQSKSLDDRYWVNHETYGKK